MGGRPIPRLKSGFDFVRIRLLDAYSKVRLLGRWSKCGATSQRNTSNTALDDPGLQYSQSCSVYQWMELWTVYPEMVDENIEITETVLRERSRLMNFIRQRVSDRMDAEDILQDVLSSLVEAFRLPTAIEHISAWLYQVARNRIIDRFRRRKEERLDETGGEDGERSIRLDLELPASDGDPEADYARSAILQVLQTALEELPDSQREVFIAHELEGKSFKQLVVETGISMNTLLSRKRYAVIYLRSRLAVAYDEFDI